MMQLTKRQKLIIKDLLNENIYTSTKELASKFNMSRRSIMYDLKNIEYWLNLKNIHLIKKPNAGIWLNINDDQRQSIETEIGSIEPYENVLNKQQRKNIILMELLRAIKPITSYDLSKKLGVSRTTVVSDLQEVREELGKYGLKLKSKPKIGLMVMGDEENIRKLMAYLMLEYPGNYNTIELLNGSDKNKRMFPFNKSCFNDLISDIDLKDIKNAVNSGKKVCDFWIPDSSYISLLVHLSIAISRLKRGQKIELADKKIKIIKENKEYLIAKEIGSELSKKYNIEIPEAEIANITYHLLSSNLKINNNEHKDEEDELLGSTVDAMIECANEVLPLDEAGIEKLKSDLISHIKLTIKKYNLNIDMENPIIDEIKANYSDLFMIAQRMADKFLDMTGISLPESEIGYITLYLGAYIESLKKRNLKKVLIVCTTGKGSAKILMNRIRINIPEIEIKGIMSAFELEEDESLLDDVDFVISTVYLRISQKPVIKVDPLLPNSEINIIRSYIDGGLSANTQYKEEYLQSYVIESLMDILDKYVAREDREKLMIELEHISGYFINNLINMNLQLDTAEKYSETSAMILTEIWEMVKEINKNYRKKIDESSIIGLIIHVIMAIPKWRFGQFNKEMDIAKYRGEEPVLFNIVKKYLDLISQKYSFKLPDSEVVSIMRYVI
jgi:transcriptional antiterminator